VERVLAWLQPEQRIEDVVVAVRGVLRC